MITESQIRSIIRKELQKRTLLENTGLMRDLTEAVSQVEVDAKNAADAIKRAEKDMLNEFDIHGGSWVAKWLEKVGIVDPCNLTDKQRKKIETERDILLRQQDEIKKLRAQGALKKISWLKGTSALAGAGSLAYFIAKNPGTTFDYMRDKSRETAFNFIDQMSEEDRAAYYSHCQKAMKIANSAGDGATSGVQLASMLDGLADSRNGLEFATHGAPTPENILKFSKLAREKLGNADANYDGSAFAIPEGTQKADIQEITDFLEDTMGPARDHSGKPVALSSEDHVAGKWIRKQVFSVDKPQTADEIRNDGQVTATQPAGQNPGVGENIAFALRSKRRTPGYKAFEKIMKKPGGPQLFASVAAQMTAHWNGGIFQGMYKSPSDFMSQMKHNIGIMGAVYKDAGSIFKPLELYLGGTPTAMSLMYQPTGESTISQEAWDHVMGTAGESNCLPPNKRFSRTGEVINKEYDTAQVGDLDGDGKIEGTLEEMDTSVFLTIAKYSAVITVSLHVYEWLLGGKIGSAVLCTIKEFSKSVVSAAGRAIRLGFDAVKGIFSFIFDFLKSKKKTESILHINIKEQYEIIRCWNNTLATLTIVERRLCV